MFKKRHCSSWIGIYTLVENCGQQGLNDVSSHQSLGNGSDTRSIGDFHRITFAY